jgi:hypothetical protein
MIFNEYISIGNKCISTIALKSLGLRKRSFPLDWTMSDVSLTLHLLKNNFKGWYPENVIIDGEGMYRNEYGISFEHYMKKPHKDIYETMLRRINRLYEVLNGKEPICFIYTTEANLFEIDYRVKEDLHYSSLINMIDFFKENYPNFPFHILAVHTNTTHINADNITNVTINTPISWISDHSESHDKVVGTYRNIVIQTIYNTLFTIGK